MRWHHGVALGQDVCGDLSQQPQSMTDDPINPLPADPSSPSPPGPSSSATLLGHSPGLPHVLPGRSLVTQLCPSLRTAKAPPPLRPQPRADEFHVQTLRGGRGHGSAPGCGSRSPPCPHTLLLPPPGCPPPVSQGGVQGRQSHSLCGLRLSMQALIDSSKNKHLPW